MGTAPLFGGLLKAAVEAPDRDALVVSGVAVSYGRLRSKVASAAALLKKEGVTPGDRVVFSAVSRPSAVYGYFACQQLGAVAVPVDARIGERGLESILEQTAPRVAYIDEDVERLDCALPGLKTAASVRPGDVADLLFTGGTTGAPKGVMQTHGNLLAFAEGRNAAVGARSDDRILLPLPLSHGFGLGRLRAGVLRGSTVILTQGFLDSEEFTRAFSAHGANALCCVPAGFALLFEAFGDRVAEWGDSLRYIETATAPLPEEQKTRLLRLLPKTRLFNSYGLTETTSSVAFVELNRHPEKAGAVGRPIPGVEVRVSGGQLQFRGPNVMKGYWRDEERTRAALQDGWLTTNDLGRVDEDGFLYLSGRKEELINVGGLKVAPAEIELALREHAAVADCACASMPDPKGVTGEAVKAFVVLRPGAAASDEELASFLRGRVEGWKIPTAFVRVDTLPRTSLGKLQRINLGTPSPSMVSPERDAAGDIAVIGMAGRFPGADGVAQFWDNLSKGVDAVTDVPPARWQAGRFKKVPGKGAFLADVDGFDAGFFGISPREAERMDPQQRLTLEVAWEALEDAGLSLEKVSGSDTGVYVGATHYDHALFAFRSPEGVSGYELAGNLMYSLAGRISYFLNLRGPSLALDAACSSSLVSVHLACRSLRDGETSLAFAGGVNLVLHPAFSLAFSEAGALSPEGRSRPLDKSADGFVRGEGAGLVVLKRLADAKRDGDRIHAVIRGSAVKHGGHSAGYTVPNGSAQESLFRAALADAGTEASDVGLIEAHATGTAVGDPIELRALASVYGVGDTCFVGSAKSTIGHLESAAGVAGLIKTVLSLKHGAVPPIAHFKEADPKLHLAETRFDFPKALTPWPKGEKPRLAAVSSFGISGTMAHVIVEESPVSPLPISEEGMGEMGRAVAVPYLLPLSVRSPEALAAVPALWAGWTASGGPGRATLQDLCFTAATRRTHHEFRHAVVFSSVEELQASLSAAVPSDFKSKKLAFVFCGQGAQWPAMGRGLLATEPVFRAFIEECDKILAPLAGWSLLAELKAGPKKSRLHKTEVLQPALFAVQAGLAALWKSRGITPAGVVGHSAGEIAAAYVAGALSLQDALAVAWHRGRLMKRAAGKGKMAAVGLSREKAAVSLKPFKGKLWIAAENGPETTVVSGTGAALRQWAKSLGEDVFFRVVNEDYAFHSHQMEPFVKDLKRSLKGLKPASAKLPVFSTVTGGPAAADAFDAAYWGKNLRERVRFADALAALAADGFDTFLEVGPHPVLALDLAQGIEKAGTDGLVLSSLKRGEPERATLLGSLGALWSAGLPVRWDALYPSGNVVDLPAYPWQRERYRLPGSDANAWGAEPSKPSAKLYQVLWNPLPALPGEVDAKRPERGTFLIFSDPFGLGAAAASRLKRAGFDTVVIEATDDYRTAAAFERLFVSLEKTPLRGILHFWGADAASVLHLTQAVVKTKLKPRLWLVTERAQAVGEAAVAAQQAPVWGLGRVIDREHPELRATLVDIGGVADVDALVEEIRLDAPEAQLALRGSNRFTPEVKALSLGPNGKAHSFRSDATYLITGGLGALGVRLARWAADHGAKHLALLGRHEPTADVRREIEGLRKIGLKVRTLRADIGDAQELARALSVVEKNAPPLRGVFHLAGTLDDGLLESVTDRRFENVMHPKTDGAANLHRALAKKKLDCFVMFSSIGSVVGEPGRGSYAAANAYLDALSESRRASGLKSLSIGWGGWAGAGMASRVPSPRLRGEDGRGEKALLDPDVALETLGRLLHSDVPAHVLATAYDLPLSLTEKALSPQAGRGGRTAAGEGLAYFRSLLSRTLRIPEHKLDVNKPLADLGLDSILAVEAAAQASRELGRRVAPASFLGKATVFSVTSSIDS